MSDRRPLYVRLPAAAADRLDRAAFERKVAKQDLVAELVTHHLDDPRRVTVELPDEGLTVGRHAFRPADPPEVLTLAGAPALLQVPEAAGAERAGAGQGPARGGQGAGPADRGRVALRPRGAAALARIRGAGPRIGPRAMRVGIITGS